MSYVDKHLLPAERVVYRTKLHPIVFAPGALLVALAIFSMASMDAEGWGVLILLVGCLLLVSAAIKQATSEFTVTTRRVIIKSGWLSRKTTELQLAKIESVNVYQPFMGRVLDYGTLILGGTGGSKETFKGIRAPAGFQNQVEEQLQLVRKPEGTPLASETVLGAGPREERECPYCAERILASASRCRFCGQSVTPAVRAPASEAIV